ncbi:glycosyltransferase family 2 protein [Desulforhabdus amnigena]|uniref:Glycosyltransferase 2-like domain-containing protein n=1 Tax=Desulforhabdus amnigena TaxID=40218 RepID=A0A9W6FW19_9BACT|nr:glycosyltransferase family 2 protein [Desulforhabdus amnigena]GLI35904.1 hypothetical protein DAMNIGENAA_33370 [Desulforhabdus amnigena]
MLAEMLTNLRQSLYKNNVSIKSRIGFDNLSDSNDVSIIIPAHNEKENLFPLAKLLQSNLSKLNSTYEIIFIDDGSDDGTITLLNELFRANTLQHMKIVQLRKHFGQASALQTGFNLSNGKIIVTMDADLQCHPQDIQRFLEKIHDGYDLVIGWRTQVPTVRALGSHLFNRLARFLLKVDIRDINCGFRAFQRTVARKTHFYGGWHRLFPALAAKQGAHYTSSEDPVDLTTAQKCSHGVQCS